MSSELPMIKTPVTTIRTSLQQFQSDMKTWLIECFGNLTHRDPAMQRRYRFFEEAAEVAQAAGMTKDECIKLIDYVYARPVGKLEQEIGGCVTVLCGLAIIHNIDVQTAANTELNRMFENIDRIREKDKTKPINSPLPGAYHADA